MKIKRHFSLQCFTFVRSLFPPICEPARGGWPSMIWVPLLFGRQLIACISAYWTNNGVFVCRQIFPLSWGHKKEKDFRPFWASRALGAGSTNSLYSGQWPIFAQFFKQWKLPRSNNKRKGSSGETTIPVIAEMNTVFDLIFTRCRPIVQYDSSPVARYHLDITTKMVHNNSTCFDSNRVDNGFNG